MGDRSRAVWRLDPVWALRCAKYFTVELDSIGLAINIAASIMWHAGAGEVLLMRTLMDLTCGSGLVFGPASNHFSSGVSGEFDLFRPDWKA